MGQKIQSMTGYGFSEDKGFRVEVRSVNHRFLDIHFKMPSFFHPYEMSFRRFIRERFARGRMDINIGLTEDTDVSIMINRKFAESLFTTLRQLHDEYATQDVPSLDHLFWFRDHIFSQEPQFDADNLFHTFVTALDNLKEMRISEGEHMIKEIIVHADALQDNIEIARVAAQDIEKRTFERLKEKIGNLVGDAVDETRMLQEVAIVAERADIDEEVTRMASHVKQMRKIVSEGGTMGRKVDFLLQELFREINTVGSKSNEYSISDLVIQMKSLVEKKRELIQNVQ